MRAFKDITEQELDKTVRETIYYYLLSDIVESSKANDKEAFKQALDIAVDTWEKRDDKVKDVIDIIKRNCEPDDSYADFEDSLFEATEHEIY